MQKQSRSKCQICRVYVISWPDLALFAQLFVKWGQIWYVRELSRKQLSGRFQLTFPPAIGHTARHDLKMSIISKRRSSFMCGSILKKNVVFIVKLAVNWAWSIRQIGGRCCSNIDNAKLSVDQRVLGVFQHLKVFFEDDSVLVQWIPTSPIFHKK